MEVVGVFLRLCLLLAVFSKFVNSNKYTKDKNMAKDEIIKMERPFRMAKVNLLWEKARKRLSKNQLAELYAELKLHDKKELQLKQIIADDLDKDGEKAARIRKEFRGIMIKYDLDDHFEHEEDNEVEKTFNSKPRKEAQLINKKLKKLWKKAEYAGFSAQELEDLKQEFSHYQTRLDEYHQLLNEADEWQDVSDNSIKNFEDNTIDGHKKRSINSDLKKRHKDLKMDYERLEFLAKKVPDGETKFTEPKVHELWMQAKQVDFSPEELVAFEEELRHFEHKLKKHADMTKEFEETVKDYKKSGKDIPLKVEKMDEKNRDYAKKIKKHHTELQRKIDKRHIEL